MVVPEEPGTVVPEEPGAVVDGEPGTVVPDEPGEVVLGERGIVVGTVGTVGHSPDDGTVDGVAVVGTTELDDVVGAAVVEVVEDVVEDVDGVGVRSGAGP
jgi:hypothetical protein